MSTPTNIESEPAQETPAPPPVAAPVPASTPAPPPPPEEDEEDDLTVEVPVGTTCRHKGCGKTFVSNETSRLGDGQETVCIYHPKTVSKFAILSAASCMFLYSPSSTKAARYGLEESLTASLGTHRQ